MNTIELDVCEISVDPKKQILPVKDGTSMRRMRPISFIGMLATFVVTSVTLGQHANRYPVQASSDANGYLSGHQTNGPTVTLGVPQEITSIFEQLPPGCTQTWPGNGALERIPVDQAGQFKLTPQRFSAKAVAARAVIAQAPRHAPPPRLPSGSKLGTPKAVPIDQIPLDQIPLDSGSMDGLLGDPSTNESLSPDDGLNLTPSGEINSDADPLSGIGPADDPLSGMGPNEPTRNAAGMNSAPPLNNSNTTPEDTFPAKGYDPYAEAFAETLYPSALTCAKCHPRHYDEWRTSAHAYAAISPMFHRFEQRLSELSQGTLGHFCVRCHAPIATQLDVPRYISALDAPRVFREGISCVACHRVTEFTGKTNGERRIEPGDIHQPIVSSGDGRGVAESIADKVKLKLKLSPDESGPGQPMHGGVIRFETLNRSEFCASCHQVAVHPGVFLEVVYGQYRASPAAAKGQSCQDCHMGEMPGKPGQYACTQIAELGGKPWGTAKKHAHHGFWGPGVSIAHPGIFPHNPKADRWSSREWLLFDWRAGWGEKEFERNLETITEKPIFPKPWDEADDRRDARKVLDDNLKALARKRAGSIATMEGAIAIEGPEFNNTPRVGNELKFAYKIRNTSEGHNLPTGSLGAQPQLWVNAVLIGPDGNRVWESGDLDANSDLRDHHSELVLTKQAPADEQLVNLQTKFLITNLKGTDREAYLPVNFDIDQIPFLRPGTLPISVLNHPPFIRMEAHSIPALGERIAAYCVPGERLCIPGTYRLTVRLRSRMEPPYFMRFVRATPEMIRSLNEQILDLRTQSFTFTVNGH